MLKDKCNRLNEERFNWIEKFMKNVDRIMNKYEEYRKMIGV